MARLAHMPVSTLRIWEQRYQAVAPTTAPSGHRLYSAADVERVLLLRQLTEQGHAIGALAALDAAQLQQVAKTQAARGDPPARRASVLRVAVVGQAMALRLQRPEVGQRLTHRWRVVAVFDSLAEAGRPAAGAAADLLLWQAPGLQASALPELKAAQRRWHAGQVAVAYRYAGAEAKAALSRTGAAVTREPADDAALGAWLASLEGAMTSHDEAPEASVAARHSPSGTAGQGSPRRFDDAALTAFAGLSSTIACECPRHVAELLMQLASFEAYSADCQSRSPADAELHAHLRHVAGVSRTLFESALERVARHEGLKVP